MVVSFVQLVAGVNTLQRAMAVYDVVPKSALPDQRIACSRFDQLIRYVRYIWGSVLAKKSTDSNRYNP